MITSPDTPVPTTAAPAVPAWKSLVLVAVFMAAASCIVKYNIIHGALLFCGAIFMQTCGSFSNAQAIAGETKRRTAIFVSAWVLLVVMACAAQQVFPPFKDVFASFGADLPLPTRLAMAYYPLVQILPFAVALVWQFWPQRTSRLRAASIVCWSCIVLLVLMLGFMYLPIINLGRVV